MELNQTYERGMSTRCDSQGRVLVVLMLCFLLGSLAGCAAVTNPVANGIPVRMLPPELLAAPPVL